MIFCCAPCRCRCSCALWPCRPYHAISWLLATGVRPVDTLLSALAQSQCTATAPSHTVPPESLEALRTATPQHRRSNHTGTHPSTSSLLLGVLVVLRLTLCFLVKVLVKKLHCRQLHFEPQKRKPCARDVACTGVHERRPSRLTSPSSAVAATSRSRAARGRQRLRLAWTTAVQAQVLDACRCCCTPSDSAHGC